jgi:acyl-ACP thioesterase
MDDLVAIPDRGRTFSARRHARLADLDARGRLRLDAIARFLQDVAIDDVAETGWGVPEHLWFVRRIRVDVLEPFLEDREVELVTWCSGLSTLAAGRRWSLTGDRGGRAEVDSVWIHLGRDGLPARIGDFGPYAEAANGRRVSARPELADPPPGSARASWPLRATDVDQHGHVNNAVYWQAVEHRLLGEGPDLRLPLRARLDYREPVDLGDDLELAASGDAERIDVGFVVSGRVKAVASIEQLLPPATRGPRAGART